MCATMRGVFSLTGKPLKCRLRPMVVFIGTTLEGWVFFVVFSVLANKRCCTKPNEKHTQAPSSAPLRRGKHAALPPGGWMDIFEQQLRYEKMGIWWNYGPWKLEVAWATRK